MPASEMSSALATRHIAGIGRQESIADCCCCVSAGVYIWQGESSELVELYAELILFAHRRQGTNERTRWEPLD